MKPFSTLLILLGSLLCQAEAWSQPETAPAPGGTPEILGWAETVLLQPSALWLEAKLDTGAETSSLDADRLSLFERDGEEWVAFDLQASRDGHRVTQRIERPVERWVRIRSAASAQCPSVVDRRPVIRLQICVADQEINTEFSLRDRSGMSYPMLIGRRALALLGAVDAGRSHLHAPCQAAEITPVPSAAADRPTPDHPQDPDVR